jgi:pantetheine-phosphate adenylyltransferase
MPTTALYPGSFDPITRGHEDVVERACQVFDEVVVAVAWNSEKTSFFSKEQRLELVRQSVGHLPKVRLANFSGLTVEFARKVGATAIVRGLRAVSDFEYECAMSQMNRTLAPELQTVLLMSGLDFQFLSSRMVREVSRLKGDVSALVAPHVCKALAKRWESLGESSSQS